MKIVIALVVLVLQIIVGQLLGFGGASVAGIGGGLELVVIPLGNTLGVWGVGALAAVIQKSYKRRPYLVRLIGTAVGSAIGVAAILLTPPLGAIQIAFPLVGALVGYYVAPLIRR